LDSAAFYLPRFLLAIPPVFVFLFALRVLDSYKLVAFVQVLRCIAWGCAAALACFTLDSAIFALSPERADWHARLGAPIIEELLKAGYVIWLVRTARVGFLVDAAICGFAAGAGFALIENVYYIRVLAGSSLAVWTLRGFGTAIMHGGTTAIVALVGLRAGAGGGNYQPVGFLAGLAISGLIHSAWNMALMTPLEASLTVLIALPVIFVFVFIRSERSLHRWMGEKLDHDLELLETLGMDPLPPTRTGRYLELLRKTFPEPVVADMFRVLTVSSELSGAAKGNLIRVAAGLPAAAHPETVSRLRELRTLEKRIGPAGCHALAPLRTRSSNDLWEMKQLLDGDYST